MKKQMTNDEFDYYLVKVIAEDLRCNEGSVEMLLGISGIYEVLSEEFNNAAIEAWEEDQEEEEEEEPDPE